MKENEKKYWISEGEFKKQNLELYQSLQNVSVDNNNKKENNNNNNKNNNNNPKISKKRSLETITDTKRKRLKFNYEKELRDIDIERDKLLKELKKFQKK